MTTQAAHKWQCSEQRALCGVTTKLQSNRSPLEHMGVLRDTQNFKFYDIKSIRSQKMSTTNHFDICGRFFGLLSWYKIDIGLLITITHHKYTFLIHSTPMKLMCTQQPTLRNMYRLLGIFAYTPET